MSALAILMIVGCGSLALTAGLAAWRAPAAWRLGAVVAILGSAVWPPPGSWPCSTSSWCGSRFTGSASGGAGVQVDQLAGLFLILTGAVSAPLFLAAATEGPGAARVLRPLLVLCVVGVIVVDNVFEFLILFELTVVAIYALISVRYEDPRADRAASLTLTLAKLGGGAVLAGLVLLGVEGGSFSFEQLAHTGPQLSSAVRGVCFALLFVGFGVKAALIPLQTWLPGAYGETDADSSGFVAAVSLNVAFYAMLRVWFGFLGHPAVWWAVVALLVGALTALIGILGGVLQREFRLFVAYSSIENSGLIVTDLGLALMGKAQHRPGLIGRRTDRGGVPDHRAQLRQGRAVRRGGRGRAQHRDERHGAPGRPVPAAAGGGDRDPLRRRGARRAAAVQRLRLRMARAGGVDAGLPRVAAPDRIWRSRWPARWSR